MDRVGIVLRLTSDPGVLCVPKFDDALVTVPHIFYSMHGILLILFAIAMLSLLIVIRRLSFTTPMVETLITNCIYHSHG